MLFNSFEFIVFLPIVFYLYWFVAKERRWQNMFVVIDRILHWTPYAPRDYKN